MAGPEMRTVRRIPHWLFVAALFSAAMSLTGCARKPETREDEEFERALSEVERKLDVTEEKMKEELGVAGPDQEVFFESFFGMGKMRSYVKKAREAAANVEVTDEDLEGLRAYTLGDYAAAVEEFDSSNSKKPNRGFPLYFLGAVAFQRREYAEARGFFSKVVSAERESRSAYLMRRLAELCEGREDVGTIDLIVLFDRACRDALAGLSLGDAAPTMMDAFLPPLASDPILLKALELFDLIARERAASIAEEYLREDRPHRRLALARLLGDDALVDQLVEEIAGAYPEAVDIQVFAFLNKHLKRPEGTQHREDFVAELAAVRKLDEGNGALMLLNIPHREPAGEDLTYAPLAREELENLRKAANARSFDTFTHYGWREVFAERLRIYDGFAGNGFVLSGPLLHAHIRNVAMRALSNATGLFQQGKTADALRLYSDVKTIASRVRIDNVLISQLVSDAIADRFDERVQDYASETGDVVLLQSCLKDRAAACRRYLEAMVLAEHATMLPKVPIRRLVEASAQMDHGASPELPREVYLRKLKLNSEEYLKSALDFVPETPERSIGSIARRYIVLLGDLGEESSVPRLEKWAEGDDLLASYLAEEALAAIRGNKPEGAASSVSE